MQAVCFHTSDWKNGERGPNDLAVKLTPVEYRVEVGGFNHQIAQVGASGNWSVNRWPTDKVHIPPYVQALDNHLEWRGIVSFEGTHVQFETAELAAKTLEQLYTSVSSNG